MNSDPTMVSRNAEGLDDEALRSAHRARQLPGQAQLSAGSGVGGLFGLKDLKSMLLFTGLDPLHSEGHALLIKQLRASDFDRFDTVPDILV